MSSLLGETLDGRFVLRSELGAGGMAVVYLADDLARGTQVAVKAMNEASASEPELIKRFRREFAACAAFSHPNVARLHAFGTLPDGRLYYAMDYLPCDNLEAHLDDRGRFDPPAAAAVLTQVADALGYAHARGVVHRDVKPSNVLLDGEGRAYLVDFGLLRSADLTQLTRTGALVGTPRYSTPEAFRGTPLDHRSDLFQLGLLAFELVTGEPAFDGSSLPELAHRIMDDAHRPPSALVPALSPAWDAFVDNCLAKSPDDRYQDAAAARADLDRLSRGEPVRALRPPVPAREAPSLALAPARAPAAVAGPRPSPLLLAGALLALAGLVAGGVHLVAPRRPARAWTVTEWRARPGFERIEVAWRSEEPYPSSVELVAPARRVVRGEEAGPVTSHVVVVRGLPEGTPCTFRILFPSGEGSLPKTVATSPFTVELAESVELPRGGVALAFRSTVCGGAATLDATLAGRREPVTRDAVEQPAGTYRIELSEPPETLTSMTLTLSPPAGRPRVVDAGALLRHEVTYVAGQLASFRPETLVEDMRHDLPFSLRQLINRGSGGPNEVFGWEPTAEQRAREVTLMDEARRDLERRMAALRARAVNDPSYGLWRRAAALAPVALASPLVAWRERLALHERLQRMQKVFLYGCVRGFDLDVLRPPALGAFGAEAERLRGVDDEVVLWDGGPGKALALGLGPPIGHPDARKSRELSFDLRSPDGVQAAQLLVTARSVYRAALRLSFNGRVDLYACGPTIQVGAGRVSTIHQRVPPEALIEDENKLTMTYDALFDNVSDRDHDLHRVVLLVRRAKGR